MSTVLHRSHLRAAQAEFQAWTVGDLLQAAVTAVPDRLALIWPAGPGGRRERRWTYRELQLDAERAARALLTVFQTGDRVATWAGASPEILMLQLGAALAGLVPDPSAMILFTSGTTGKPKGVVLHHAGIVNNAHFSTDWARAGRGNGSMYYRCSISVVA